MKARNLGGGASDGMRMGPFLYLVAREDDGGGLRFEAPRCYATEDEAGDRFDELVLQAKGERYFVIALPSACVRASTGDTEKDMGAMRARHTLADADPAAAYELGARDARSACACDKCVAAMTAATGKR
jgi:hypothetical protein